MRLLSFLCRWEVFYYSPYLSFPSRDRTAKQARYSTQSEWPYQDDLQTLQLNSLDYVVEIHRELIDLQLLYRLFCSGGGV